MKQSKPTTISNNTFTGVVWDAKSVEAIQTVATGLLNLTKLFISQNINIDAMLKIEKDDR